MKQFLAVFLFLSLAVSFGFAQDAGSIDVATGKATISSLEADNSKLEADKTKLTADFDASKARQDAARAQLAKLIALMDKVAWEGSYLADKAKSTVDAAAKKKATDAYNEYKGLYKQLETKKASLENTIKIERDTMAATKDKIDAASFLITVNLGKIEATKKGMEKSQNRGTDIDNHITTLNSLKADSAAFVQ